MKKTILLFLRGEAAKKDAPTYHSLDTYLLKMYPNAGGKEVKAVLLELQREGLATISGSWNSLGAKFAGVEQTLKQVTVHAHLTPKGLDAANELATPVPSVTYEPALPGKHEPLQPESKIPLTPGLPPKLPVVPELPKTPVTAFVPPAPVTQGSPQNPDLAAFLKDKTVVPATEEHLKQLEQVPGTTETVNPSLTIPEVHAPTVPVAPLPNNDGLDDL